MTYHIEIKRSARKALLALPRDMQRRIGATIDRLASNPRGSGTRKISGSDILYRLRVGDYRVVYEIRDDRLLNHQGWTPPEHLSPVTRSGRRQVLRTRSAAGSHAPAWEQIPTLRRRSSPAVGNIE